MVLSTYERRLRRYRRELLTLDNRASANLENAYRDATEAIQQRIVRRSSRGADPDRFDLVRLRALQQQIDQELARLADQAEQIISTGQRTTARLGAQQALGLMEAQVPRLAASFTRLPVPAIETLVGTLVDGSPLRLLLNQQGLAAADAASRVLTNALAVGAGPREVARDLRRILGHSRWRSEVLARNALLDAHRLARLQTYARNPGILAGWRWTAALSSRTCLACLALHGRVFPLSQQFFPRHPACRCSPSPELHDWLGVPPPFEPGEAWLRRQAIDVQRAIVPATLWSDYRSGAVELADFVAEDYSPRWGRSLRQATVAEVRSNAARRERVVA